MFVISLKLLLAFILTAMPFAFHIFVKPQVDGHGKWHSLPSLFMSVMPKLCSWKRRVIVWLVHFRNRMKSSVNARKFFTLVLCLVMLLVQAVDFYSVNESWSVHERMIVEGRTVHCVTDCCFEQIGDLLSDSCYPYQTSASTTLAMLSLAVLIMNHKMANAVLVTLKKYDVLFVECAVFVLVFTFVGCGHYMVVAECLLCVMMASVAYPDISRHISYDVLPKE